MLEDLTDALVNILYVVEHELISTGCNRMVEVDTSYIIFVFTALFWCIKLGQMNY